LGQNVLSGLNSCDQSHSAISCNFIDCTHRNHIQLHHAISLIAPARIIPNMSMNKWDRIKEGCNYRGWKQIRNANRYDEMLNLVMQIEPSALTPKICKVVLVNIGPEICFSWHVGQWSKWNNVFLLPTVRSCTNLC
jgi:hypothetical protein